MSHYVSCNLHRKVSPLSPRSPCLGMKTRSIATADPSGDGQQLLGGQGRRLFQEESQWSDFRGQERRKCNLLIAKLKAIEGSKIQIHRPEIGTLTFDSIIENLRDIDSDTPISRELPNNPIG